MAVASSVSGGGFRHLQIYELTSAGLPSNTTPGSAAYPGVQVDVAKTFTPTIPEATVIQISGDDVPKGQIILPGTESVSVAMTTGKSNLTVDAILTGLSVVTIGDQKLLVRESEKRGCLTTVGILGYQQGIDNVSGSATRGNTVWRAFWIPKANIVPLGGGMEEGNALESSYTAYAQVVNAHLWGMVFLSGTEGCTEGQMIEAFYNGPPVLDTWEIDSTPTLALVPSQTARADEAGTGFDVQIYKWATATGVVTNITAGATIAASLFTVVGAVEGDVVCAVYSKAGCP
jgi:hypothetical protein